MRKFLMVILLLIMSIVTVNATIYENAEDGNISRWVITDSDPIGATVKNIFDNGRGSRVIELNGTNYKNQYMIGGELNDSSRWNESENLNLLWSLKSDEGFLIDIILETQNGTRYIRYSDNENNLGLDGDTIHIGLGYSSADGAWHDFNRNLQDDLKQFESNNTIIAINGLKVRGSCSLDNIEIIDDLMNGDFTIYEDGEDNTTSGWSITDDTPSGATITNIFDSDTHSRVIKLQGDTTYDNEYKLGGAWNNSMQFNIKWDMKTTEGFIIDIVVVSANGERYLRYTDNEESYKGKDGDIIYHGLGYYPTDGHWHTFRRNLEDDLKEIEPNNQIISISAFLIRGNCRLDNIELFQTQSKMYEDAEDNRSDRWRVYNGVDANISNIYDTQKGSRVISFEGNGYENQYIIGGDGVDDVWAWGDTVHSNIRWSMQNSDGFIIYLIINTQNGVRYMKYLDDDFSQKGIDGNIIYHGLGYDSANGKWHTFVRDIQGDLKEFEPNNELLSVEGFLLINGAKIDDLELFTVLHPASHKAGVTLTFDDHDVDGWFSLRDTFQKYGAKVTFFVDYFHERTEQEINELKILEQDGHEIGCHTYSHKGIGRDYHYDIGRIDEYIQSQIASALNNMKNAGFNPQSLAYPYGEHQADYDSAVRAYFPYLRITASDNNRELYELNEIYHKGTEYYNLLAGDGLDNSYNNDIDEIRDALLKARKQGEIITFYAHQVLDDPNNPYASSPEKLKAIMEMAKDMGLEFYTFKNSYLVNQ